MNSTALTIVALAGCLSPLQAQPYPPWPKVWVSPAWVEAQWGGYGKIAPGAIFQVDGYGLGPENPQVAGFPLGKNLAGTSVRVTVGETAVDALVLQAGWSGVRMILPSSTPLGDASLVVEFNGERSNTFGVQIVRQSPGIWGGVAQNFYTAKDVRTNAYDQPARPGQPVVLWGTGFGPVAGDEAAGPLPGDLHLNLEVLVGGKRARVLYAGRSGCCAGIDQIVFETPAGVEGCRVPVVVRLPDQGLETQYVRLSIAASGGRCTYRGGIPQSLLEKLDQRLKTQGHLDVGSTSLGSFSVEPTERGGSLTASFWRQSSEHVEDLIPDDASMAPGTCAGVGAPPGYSTSGGGFQILDAGPTLTLQTPQGPMSLSRTSPPQGWEAVEYYDGGSAVPERLAAGNYSLDNGGRDDNPWSAFHVSPFRVEFALPEVSFSWTNQDGLNAVRRAEGFPITWSGGDPATGYVVIYGSFFSYTEAGAGTAASFFQCFERADQGKFFVPPEILSQPNARSANALVLYVRHLLYRPLEAPGLDLLMFRYSVANGRRIRVE